MAKKVALRIDPVASIRSGPAQIDELGSDRAVEGDRIGRRCRCNAGGTRLEDSSEGDAAALNGGHVARRRRRWIAGLSLRPAAVRSHVAGRAADIGNGGARLAIGEGGGLQQIDSRATETGRTDPNEGVGAVDAIIDDVGDADLAARIEGDEIVTDGVGENGVRLGRPDQCVVAGAGDQSGIAAGAVERVVAMPADDRVVLDIGQADVIGSAGIGGRNIVGVPGCIGRCVGEGPDPCEYGTPE